MPGDEAKVKIGVQGAREAQGKVKELGKAFKGMGAEIGTIGAAMLSQFSGVALALAKVDPSSAAGRFRTYRQSLIELSVASGRSVDAIKGQFANLQKTTLLPDEQLAKFGNTLAKTTYDFGDSTQAIQALRESGAAAGKSLEEMGPIASTLHNSFGETFGQMPESLARIGAAADTLGTIGGPGVLMDSIASLGSMISQVSVKGKKDADELIGALAAVGKGLNPEAQKRVQSKLLGVFTSGGEQFRENLHISRKDFYDEQGHIKVNEANVKRLRDYYLKRTGGSVSGARRLASFSNNLGPELAFNLFSPDFMKNLDAAKNAPPSDKAAKALSDAIHSQAGQQIKRQQKTEQQNREGVGSPTNDLQDWALKAMPNSPVSRYAVTEGISGLVHGAVLVGGIKVASKWMAARGATAALGETGAAAAGATETGAAVAGAAGTTGAAALLGGAALVAGAGAAGYGIGTYVDKKLDLSGKIAKGLYDLFHPDVAKERAAIKGPVQTAAAAALGGVPGVPGAPIPVTIVGIGAPVTANVHVTDSSHHPNHFVGTQKGKAARQ